jgi:hypothetical protein
MLISLRNRFCRPLAARGDVRRQDPQGRETRRPTGRTGDEIRDDGESEDRQGDRRRSAVITARARRRGGRMKREFMATLDGAAAWACRRRDRLPVIGFSSPAAPNDKPAGRSL